MFNTGNIKKEYLLAAATAIVLIICYQLAFKKTIEAWQIDRQLKTQLAQSSDMSIQPGYVERKNVNLDRVLDLYKADTINFRSNIISKISSVAEAENVKLAEVPNQDPAYRTSQFTIQKLSFEGDYSSLVKTISNLQKEKGIGIVRSAVMKTVASHANNDEVKKLILEVYLEVAENPK
ncbi:MAG TPA: hypothetical protein VK671_15275 [Mucilaginibacter sp.]|jgi:hypothetical protein|nr:hypothetical protein [Mucilaginibacter sp.]